MLCIGECCSLSPPHLVPTRLHSPAGTRKFGDCTRQLLLDRLTVLRIRSHILANDLAAAPLPELSARPSSQYSNVALVEPDSVDRLKAKEWSLKLNNYGRARRAAVREDWLDAARQAVCAEDGGSILAISAVAFEQGKKVS